jgi:hypothetical protein
MADNQSRPWRWSELNADDVLTFIEMNQPDLWSELCRLEKADLYLGDLGHELYLAIHRLHPKASLGDQADLLMLSRTRLRKRLGVTDTKPE